MKLSALPFQGMTIQDVLRKKYPDIVFDIIPEPSLHVTTFVLMKKDKKGGKAAIKIRITDTVVEANPNVIHWTIEDAVRKLRDYVDNNVSVPEIENNPSSRRFR